MILKDEHVFIPPFQTLNKKLTLPVEVVDTYRKQFAESKVLREELSAWSKSWEIADKTLLSSVRETFDTSCSTISNVIKTSGAQQAVHEARASLQTLVSTSEQRLETLSNQSQKVFVEEAKIYRLIEGLKKYRTDLEAERVSVSKTEGIYFANLNAAESDLISALRRLQIKQQELDVCPSILLSAPAPFTDTRR
jgi:hypothetical protein